MLILVSCKAFPLDRPGSYSQMLLVWDGIGNHPDLNSWNRLEMFGFEMPAEGAADKKP